MSVIGIMHRSRSYSLATHLLGDNSDITPPSNPMEMDIQIRTHEIPRKCSSSLLVGGPRSGR
jgi:hypothetical protein